MWTSPTSSLTAWAPTFRHKMVAEVLLLSCLGFQEGISKVPMLRMMLGIGLRESFRLRVFPFLFYS